MTADTEPPFDPPYHDDTPGADHGRDSTHLRREAQRAAKPKMADWREVRFYDPYIDGEGVRVSGFSDRGGEFWSRQPLKPAGRERVKQRHKTLAAIEQAIMGGREPGEVIVEG
jgi:hypothetical protein